MKCQRCKSTRLVHVDGKTSDLCSVVFAESYNIREPTYVPENIGIGGGDYITFTYCLNCGQIQGKFPIANKDNS